MTVAAVSTALREARDEKQRRRRSELEDQLAEFGLDMLLADPAVREIDINEDGTVWVDRLGELGGTREEVCGVRFDAEAAESLAVGIVQLLGGRLNEDEDDLVGKLPIIPGVVFSRVSLHAPPAVDQHTVCIRKLDAIALPLRRYVERGELDEDHYAYIVDSQRKRDNTITVGPMFAGKSTFQNSLLGVVFEVDPNRRYGYVDPVGETVCTLRNTYGVRPSKTKSERDRIRELMTRNLNAVSVAETKSAVAYDLVDAWNTHNGGHTTTHGRTARGGLTRIESLYRMAGLGEPQRDVIADVVQTIVAMDYHHDVGRRVIEVARIVGLDKNGEYELEYVGARYRLTGRGFERVAA